jgi:hypothetical protein
MKLHGSESYSNDQDPPGVKGINGLFAKKRALLVFSTAGLMYLGSQCIYEIL